MGLRYLQVWFSNRRAKWRREEKLRNKRPGVMDTSMSNGTPTPTPGSGPGSNLAAPMGNSPASTPNRFTQNPATSFVQSGGQMYGGLPQQMDHYGFGFANTGLGMTPYPPADFGSHHMFNSRYDFNPYGRLQTTSHSFQPPMNTSTASVGGIAPGMSVSAVLNTLDPSVLPPQMHELGEQHDPSQYWRPQ